MPSFEALEERPRRPHLSAPRVHQSLTDAFPCICVGGNIEEPLIGTRVLHHGRGFPFTVSTTGRLLLLSCFMTSPDRRRKVVSDWISLVISSVVGSC
jgi:hypothetical protein